MKKKIQEGDKGLESAEMYARYGNRNLRDLKGAAAMATMDDDSEIANIGMNDMGMGDYNPYDEEGEFPVDEPMSMKYRAAMESKKAGKVITESQIRKAIARVLFENGYLR